MTGPTTGHRRLDKPAARSAGLDAVDDHQSANARELEQCGAAIHLPQSELSVDGLLALIEELCADPQRLKKMAESAHEAGRPDAVKHIADALEQEVAHV